MKKYSTWLRIAAAFQFLSAIAHTIALFSQQTPTNEKEEKLLALMSTHKLDMGMGVFKTTNELVFALSSCFVLLYGMAGWLNLYLLKKKTGYGLMRGVILIQTVTFGIAFALMVRFTFIPPITLTGLTFLAILLAWVTVPKKSNSH